MLRVSAKKPHPDALPVIYDPPDVDRVENDLRQKPISDWQIKDDAVHVTYRVTRRDLDAEKADAKQRVRAMRKEAERAGIKFDGVCIATTTKAQIRIGALASSLALDDTIRHVDFECKPGEFVTLPRERAIAMAKAHAAYVQACRSRARVLCEQIDTATSVAGVRAVDFRSGWPEK